MRTPLFMYRLRKRLRGLNLVFLASSLGIAVFAAGGLVLLDEGRRDPPDGRATASVSVADPVNAASAQSGAKLAARMDAAVVEEIRQKPDADLSSLPLVELRPPLLSIDGTGFRRGEETIRLDRISGPRAGEVCFDGAQRWSCGLQARAALHNLVSGRSLFCQPRRALADGGMGADCHLEAKEALPAGDLAGLLIRLGWARPAPDREPEFAADLQVAKAAGAGLWRGGWRVSSP